MGPKLIAGDAEELEGEPEQEVDVGGDALGAELELEGEELPELGHAAGLLGGALRLN
jgi:hypothetical protein